MAWGLEAAHVLRNSEPYLIVKKAQASVALRFQEQISGDKARSRARGKLRGTQLTDVEVLWRKSMSDELKRLRACDKQY